METKVCTKCHIEKTKDCFRIRKEKYKDKVYILLDSNCKQCEREAAIAYYHRKKINPEFAENNRQRVKAYNKKNKELVNSKQKIKRQTLRYKELMKQYRKLNSDKIYAQEKITKQKFHEFHRDNISDRYCIVHLRQKGLEATAENIEIQRVQILIHRIKIQSANDKKNS